MKTDLYLASLVSCRALYREIFQEAVGLLAPVDVRATGDLVSHRSVYALARATNVGVTTVRGDLQRLLNYGWVDSIAAPRKIGRYEGAKFYLIADVAASQITGEQGLISRIILKGLITPDITSDHGGAIRGAARKWVKPSGKKVLGDSNG